MPRVDIDIRTFTDYKPYTFDNGEHVENPEYSYVGSEDPDWLVNPDTFIVHSMFVAADEESGREESFDPTDAKNLLESLGASAHFIIPQDEKTSDGRIVVYQMVQTERKAWHAGKSRIPEQDGRAEGLNHFSLSAELIASQETGISEDQYRALVGLIALLSTKFSIRNILGHNDVAGRDIRLDSPKTDPVDSGFNWEKFLTLLSKSLGNEFVSELKLVGSNR